MRVIIVRRGTKVSASSDVFGRAPRRVETVRLRMTPSSVSTTASAMVSLGLSLAGIVTISSSVSRSLSAPPLWMNSLMTGSSSRTTLRVVGSPSSSLSPSS